MREEAGHNRNYLPPLSVSPYINAYSINETSEYINVLYLASEQFYTCFYHKQTKLSSQYRLIDFLEYSEIEGGGKIVGVFNDYFITYLSPESIKSFSIKRPDLRALAEKASEEDNPILCLFKFK